MNQRERATVVEMMVARERLTHMPGIGPFPEEQTKAFVEERLDAALQSALSRTRAGTAESYSHEYAKDRATFRTYLEAFRECDDGGRMGDWETLLVHQTIPSDPGEFVRLLERMFPSLCDVDPRPYRRRIFQPDGQIVEIVVSDEPVRLHELWDEAGLMLGEMLTLDVLGRLFVAALGRCGIVIGSDLHEVGLWDFERAGRIVYESISPVIDMDKALNGSFQALR